MWNAEVLLEQLIKYRSGIPSDITTILQSKSTSDLSIFVVVKGNLVKGDDGYPTNYYYEVGVKPGKEPTTMTNTSRRHNSQGTFLIHFHGNFPSSVFEMCANKLTHCGNKRMSGTIGPESRHWSRVESREYGCTFASYGPPIMGITYELDIVEVGTFPYSSRSIGISFLLKNVRGPRIALAQVDDWWQEVCDNIIRMLMSNFIMRRTGSEEPQNEEEEHTQIINYQYQTPLSGVW